MAELSDEIKAYEQLQADLEAKHMGQWALVYDRKLIAIFDTFDAAAESAVQNFGRGPYLIRQIGSAPLVLPASVAFHVRYG